MLPNCREDLKRYCVERGYGGCPSYGKKLMTVVSSPAYLAIVHHRFGFWVHSINTSYKNPVKLFLKLLYFLGKQFVVWVAKIDILSTADIGPGFFLSNRGNIILGVNKMGENCSVSYNVTIGYGAGGKVYGLPVIGDNVRVGHDSLVYGGITVGNDVIVGDHTVLSRNIPDGFMAQGNPGKMTKQKQEVSCHQSREKNIDG